jgi:hypothetical protein
MDRMFREAIEIQPHPNNMNRENGLCLSLSSTVSVDICHSSKCPTCPQNTNNPG